MANTMKAACYKQLGGPEVLEILDLEIPEPGPGEVRVKVNVSGVNPSDWKSRTGSRGPNMPFPFIVPHSDGSGVIEDVGNGVDQKRIGQRVWLYEGQWQRQFGTAAEFIAIPSKQAVKLDDEVSFAEGACIGIPAMTAHRCLFASGPVKDMTVLVTGGAGAVGGANSTYDGGDGGVGLSNSITGAAVFYAGGGGAGGNIKGDGGNGGGAYGAQDSGNVAVGSATANTGGGGGGGLYASSPVSEASAGGSGVVILRVATSDYTGTTSGSPTVTTDGSDTIMKFTDSGSYTA